MHYYRRREKTIKLLEWNMVVWDHDETLSVLEGGGREVD